MIIDKINLNHLRLFETVYRTGSMTTAARELHLTQSGVSQHIKSLEDVLGIQLFDRIKQKLVPTAQGNNLYKHCTQGLYAIERALLDAKGRDKQLSGTVSIGMPIQFGNNVIVPLLAEFGKKHPLVKLKLSFGLASLMNGKILDGTLDFAFIDEFKMDRRIVTEKVYDELIELCIGKQLKKKLGSSRPNRKYFESIDYVAYQQDEPVLRMWFAHHLKNRNLDVNVRATVMDVQGIARLVMMGLGAGVLPGYLVSKFKKEGQELYTFKGCGKPLINTLSVAYLYQRSHSPVATAALDWLKQKLGKSTTKVSTKA